MSLVEKRRHKDVDILVVVGGGRWYSLRAEVWHGTEGL